MGDDVLEFDTRLGYCNDLASLMNLQKEYMENMNKVLDKMKNLAAKSQPLIEE